MTIMSVCLSKKSYVAVWAVLLALLVVTVGSAQLDLKAFNVVIALTIAIAKMSLIILYFMHVRFGPRLIWVFAAAGFLWLMIMIELILSDYLTRGS